MTKNKKIILILELLLIGSITACSLPGSKSHSTKRNEEINAYANDSIVQANLKPSPEDCPKTTLSVDETKNKALEKFEGCLVSVRGKIWEINGDNSISLIDTTERTGYNDKIILSGDFSNDAYYEIGRNISELKLNSEYERLPIATFTGTVDSDAWLENCVLTDVEK